MEINPIAHICTDFPSKFGIPRQSGLVEGLRARIVFLPPYRNVDALRGLDGFSHIWLLWDFSQAHGPWRPTVRPPRLGGNRRMGVWATRSPFRPNNIGLSSVRLLAIHQHTPEGPVLEVGGADLMDGTPIYDIKPYLPFTDCHPQATGGFAEEQNQLQRPLPVEMSEDVARMVPVRLLPVLWQVLAVDPRPHYHDDPTRVYTMDFAGYSISFRVERERVVVEKVTPRL